MTESSARAGCHAAGACECCDAWRYAVRGVAQALNADEDAWVDLGEVGTDVATVAVVCPLYSSALSRWWDRYVIGELVESTRSEPDTGPAYRELALSTSWSLGPDGPTGPLTSKATAVLFNAPGNGAYRVQGRFEDVYVDGHLQLVEVRVLLHEDWDGQDEEADEP